MDDIIAPEEDSRPPKRVRRIPVPTARFGRRPRKKIRDIKKTSFDEFIFNDTNSHNKRSRYILWGVALIAVGFLVVSFSTLFEHATLKIVPKQKTVELDFVFTAEKEAEDPKISYEVMTIPIVESVFIPATEVKNVERRAYGTIIIYNDYNSYSQRLVKNTRFETPEGLIYRIRESINIPGKKVVDGKSTLGSIEVIVYADESGEKYNIGLKDFTIPGFKGSARYDGFYARSKTSMENGFVGVVKTVSEPEFEKAKEKLRTSIIQQLLETVQQQKPENFILFDDGVFIVFDEDSTNSEGRDADKSTIEVMQKAVLYGIIFDKNILSERLAVKIVPQAIDGDNVVIRNLEELTFELLNKDKIDPSKDTSISFSLKGNPVFVWLFDEEALINSILGQAKSALKTTLSAFPNIIRAEIIIRPFWKQSFPEKESDITIETIIE